ncbi:MAG: RdgB/HAM1 family non-canonical purine NTP pyrophosphatase [Candidatus Accumulibacter sp.]|jgi:XTP/dITP diphosphohydrolase|nr:RdgB/HAM1 family non-canonical purine NTP pyrophosphatase [Accumulibacter sp.]
MKLVIASGNPGKLREFGELLAPLGWEAVAQDALGVPECSETHCSFVENALEKARHASRCTGLPALADDSGLCVRALGGAPGVHSARYAQTSPSEAKDDEKNNAKLVAELAGFTAPADRRARYVCVLVFVRRADDPQPIIAEGEWEGVIADAPRGTGGFGYDPWFFLPELGRTAAELSPEEKNRRSHRGQALRRLAERLRTLAEAEYDGDGAPG